MNSNPEEFKRQLHSALQNPTEKHSILEYVKVLTPNLSEEQRGNMFNILMKALDTSSTSTRTNPKEYINQEYKEYLRLAKLPTEELYYKRMEYYNTHNIPPPEKYEPRNDVSTWDMIDLYETNYYISKNINTDVHKEQLHKYISYLEEKSNK